MTKTTKRKNCKRYMGCCGDWGIQGKFCGCPCHKRKPNYARAKDETFRILAVGVFRSRQEIGGVAISTIADVFKHVFDKAEIEAFIRELKKPCSTKK